MDRRELHGHIEVLIGLMDRGEEAVARQDVDAVDRCARDSAAVIAALEAAWRHAAPDLRGATAEVAALADLMRGALARVERNRKTVTQWMEQTQDALRAMRNGQEAIGRYTDSLGAHRRELFDLSA